MINRAKAVAAVVQRRDIALLLDGYPHLAVRAGADGAHLPGIEALTAALPTLKPDRIAGAGGLHSRHDAMLAAEAGADYVMFGEPDRRGGRPAFDAIEERLNWWSELFEQPCVGYAASLDEVAPLAQAGADFVALGDWIWTQAEAPAAVIARLPAASPNWLGRPRRDDCMSAQNSAHSRASGNRSSWVRRLRGGRAADRRSRRYARARVNSSRIGIAPPQPPNPTSPTPHSSAATTSRHSRWRRNASRRRKTSRR